MFGFKKKREDGTKSPTQGSPPLAPTSTERSPSGIKIGSVQNSASAEQLDQVATNKQKIPSLFRLLAEHKLSERDIWEGEPQLFSILYQFKEQLSKNESSTSNIITFHLPSIPEFADVKKKSYKINRKFTIAQTINLICKKQQIPDPKRFWISSLLGFIMNDNEPLYTYGLGSLFESWELRVIVKDDILAKSPLKYEPIDSIGTEFIVVFELPPLEQFNGLKKHVVKVDSHQTIKQAIAGICKKYRVEDPERFSVMTIDVNPLVEFVLFSGAAFKHYGLGYKFKKWDLKIVFTDLIAPYVHRHTVIPMHGWAQVSPGQLDPFTARAIINDLEEKCSEFQADIRRLQSDVQGGSELSATQQAEIERLRAEIRRMQAIIDQEREQTAEQNEIYESKLSACNAEIEALSGQVRGLKSRLDESGQLLSTANIANQDLHSSLHMCQGEREQLNVQVQEATAEIAELTSRLERVRGEAVRNDAELTAMIATLEREKVAIKDEARMSIERLSTEKVSTEESAKHLVASQALLVTQLQDDVASMQRERELMAQRVQRATLEQQEAVQQAERAERKMEELNKNVKRVERQFGDLERERDVLRQQVQIKLDEIADVQKDLEWQRQTTSELERRLQNASGEAKMYKDIKDKESARFKQSSAEESKTKGELDTEKQRMIDAQARFAKQLATVEAKAKTQEAAYRNADASFKKREAELKKENDEMRAKYEELRVQVAGGQIKQGTVVPQLATVAEVINPLEHLRRHAKVEEVANSPVLISMSPDLHTSSSSSSNGSTETEEKEKPRPAITLGSTREIAADADSLYKSLQTRFTTINNEAIEDLDLSENEYDD
eukprot:gene5974-6920_t